MTDVERAARNFVDRGACPWCDRPAIGATRTCPDCGRPQHYTGREVGWAHDALIDTWHCCSPSKDGQ